MALVKYNYDCGICGQEIEHSPFAPESIHWVDGKGEGQHSQACPKCAIKIKKTQGEAVKVSEDEDFEKEERKARAAERLAQIKKAKPVRIDRDDENGEDDVDAIIEKLSSKRRTKKRRSAASVEEVLEAFSGARDALSDAEDALDDAQDNFDAAREALVEALELEKAPRARRARR